MRQFYTIFPNCNALRSELSWTQYRLLMRVGNDSIREFYIEECIKSNWSSRQLERQINSFPSETELQKYIEERERLEERELQYTPEYKTKIVLIDKAALIAYIQIMLSAGRMVYNDISSEMVSKPDKHSIIAANKVKFYLDSKRISNYVEWDAAYGKIAVFVLR